MSDLNRDKLRCAIEVYLDDTHSTLWGRAFDIKAENSREKAIEFIADLIESVTDVGLAQQSKSGWREPQPGDGPEYHADHDFWLGDTMRKISQAERTAYATSQGIFISS